MKNQFDKTIRLDPVLLPKTLEIIYQRLKMSTVANFSAFASNVPFTMTDLTSRAEFISWGLTTDPRYKIDT
jgi:hypothetical protein